MIFEWYLDSQVCYLLILLPKSFGIEKNYIWRHVAKIGKYTCFGVINNLSTTWVLYLVGFFSPQFYFVV